MLKLLGAAVSAAILTFAGGTAMAATYLIDFEDQTVGAPWAPTIDGASIGGGYIATDGGNSYLQPMLRSPAHPNTKWLSLSGQNIGIGEYISPQIVKFDVFIAGGGEVVRPGMSRTAIAADQWVTLVFGPQPATDLDCVWGCNFFIHGGDVRIDNIVLDVSIAHVPEPATWAMMIVGFGLVGWGLRRHGDVEGRQRRLA